MADSMGKIVGVVISITVSIIVVGTVLSPAITEYSASGAALESYAGILSAIVIMSIVGCLMLAVRLISNKN